MDTWAEMRAIDPALTDALLQQAILCIRAQVDERRIECNDMGATLRHRMREAGTG